MKKKRVEKLAERFPPQEKMNGKDIRIWAEMRVDILFAPVMQDIDAKEHKTTVSPDGMKSNGKKWRGGRWARTEKKKRARNSKTKIKEKTPGGFGKQRQFAALLTSRVVLDHIFTSHRGNPITALDVPDRGVSDIANRSEVVSSIIVLAWIGCCVFKQD